MPRAKSWENLSEVFLKILKPLQRKNKKAITRREDPINPISSAIIAKIESDIVWGTKPHFWLDIPSPKPKIPPDPTAIMACFN